MINYWWVTRPKRKLNSIPEVLALSLELSLNQEWEGQRDTHLAVEDALEKAGLKRKGERRDQTGGGGRTYIVWLISLGLIFKQESTGNVKLTLAGEAIMRGDSPVEVLTHQVLKYQFPSAFSISRGVDVSRRFRVRPFKFLLRVLMDKRVQYITEEEIAKIIIVEAENESDKCYEHVIGRLLQFREQKDACLDSDFFEKYKSSKGEINVNHPFSHLMDTANTIINWIEFTQLARREDGRLIILEDKRNQAEKLIAVKSNLIDRPEQHEYFQRKFGVDPSHVKEIEIC